ncbi:MAG: VacJ family lipoprotein [Dokdonella sp.]
MLFRHPAYRLIASVLVAAMAGCATIAPPRTDDPYESFNRRMYAFNDTVDKIAIRPAAVAYKTFTSQNARRVISNFFSNVRMPITIVNDVLQGKAGLALRNTGRFVVNTTVGFLGFLDPASNMRMPPSETDFGVTLARWGLPEGPYLVLPMVGPTTGRDVFRLPVDSQFDPLAAYARNNDFKYNAEFLPSAFYLVALRASGLDAEAMLEGNYDPYVFLRDAYRQRRLYTIYEGQPPASVIETMQGQGVDGDDIDVDALLEEQRQYEQTQKGKQPPAR